MLQVHRALRDILAGGVFIALGLAFAFGSLSYEVGTPLRMGPGYVPLVLGGLLASLGIGIVIKGFLAGEEHALGGFEWRAVILITAALIFFGVTVRGLGAAPALFGASMLASLARSRTPWREALLIAVGLTALSVAIFIFALQLRLPLLGPWIPV